MATVTLTICDVCRDTSKKVTHWTIRGPLGEVELDLCADDALSLETLVKTQDGPSEPRKPRRVPRPRKGATPAMERRMATMEEIEARKQKE